MLEISKKNQTIEVLHFHETPFLDRRILAIVLRACPNLRMVGVYNCPLIHFGDLIPILDLISDINHSRRMKGEVNRIEKFDFFPYFNSGLSEPRLADPVYGLTTAQYELDVVQRGFYGILLKGFLKAREMGLNLLFEPSSAFRAFLFRVPNPPLSVPTFLDGLHRYLSKNSNDVTKRKALYDILKPVRLGLEQNVGSDYPTWYRTSMGSYLPFCASCGYEMLPEFFPAGAIRNAPHRRICAACCLQLLLDDEPHNMHREKLEVLRRLFPEWTPLAFDVDAPVGGQPPESDLLRLRCNGSERDDPPSLYSNMQGFMAATPHVLALVRDWEQKAHEVSLENLPTLKQLVEDPYGSKQWSALFNECMEMDVYLRAKARVVEEQRRKPTPIPRHLQPAGPWFRGLSASGRPCFDYVSALKFHLGLNHKRW